MIQEKLRLIIEDPKAFLLRGRNAKALIAAKRERIADWRRLAESTTIILKPDSGTSGSGYKQSIIETAICNIDSLENEILAEIEELIDAENDIREAIDAFITDDRHRAVLEMRYLNGYSWRVIGSKLYYGEDWVCKLHGVALQEMKLQAESVRVKSGYSC